MTEECSTDAPCHGIPHIMIYAGPDDRSSVYESIAGAIAPFIGIKYKIALVKHQDILSPISPSPWWANCVALFVQNDGGHVKFDDVIQKALARYFLWSGKLIFFCNPEDGRKAAWLLDAVSSTADSSDGGPRAWPTEIAVAFEKFIKDEPIPSNMQCVEVQRGDKSDEFFVSLCRASDGVTPYMHFH